MSPNASVSKAQAAPVEPSKCAAQNLVEVMRTGSCPNDRSFDRFLPAPLRLVSPEYWTPLTVAKRSAEWLEDFGIRTVVDIGSGAGKFCVAGALFGKSRFIGLEKYSSLVTSARALADLFDLTDRVSFLAGALGSATTPVGDAYYFSTRSVTIGLGPTIRWRQAPSSPTRDMQTTWRRRKICFGAYPWERGS
jgi:hypothetical protein